MITIADIKNIVCKYYNISEDKLNDKTRKREIVQARQMAMFFSKNLTRSSLVKIGAQIGGKDHATVLHACKTVNNLVDTDKRFRMQIEEIEFEIKQFIKKENNKITFKELFEYMERFRKIILKRILKKEAESQFERQRQFEKITQFLDQETEEILNMHVAD